MSVSQEPMEPKLKYQIKKCFEEEESNSSETEYSYLRRLPDMSEGLIGLCIGDIMGILMSLNPNNTFTPQQQQNLKIFIETLLKTSRSSLSIFKLSILYLYKLNKKLREYAILNLFRMKLEAKNITSMEPMKQAELLFVVIIMLAFKYTEDHCYYISAWSKATGIQSDVLHKMEVEVLNILDHNLFVSQERFESFSNRIIQKINKLKIDLLQSVKISYASSNYSSSSEEESIKSDASTAYSFRCKKCCCKRKQDCLENNSLYKKRKVNQGLTIDTNDTTADNASSFYTLPTTLYNYYGNCWNKQPLTPPTPNTYLTTTPVTSTIPAIQSTYNTNNTNNNDNSNNNNNNNNNNHTNNHNNNHNSNNSLLQVDSLIIPSTPPTSQTSVYEDMEREEEIKYNKDHSEDEGDFEEYEEDGENEGEEEEDEEIDLPKNHNGFKSSTMAFILNPDENKIQFDSGEDQANKYQSKTIPYHYHAHTPTSKTNFSYENLKKVNLLEKKNEKTRTTASIVLPNTSPVGDVASVFPSLSMLSHSTAPCNDLTVEDTTFKVKAMGLKSLLVDRNSAKLPLSQEVSEANPLFLKSNFMNMRDDTINDDSNINNNSLLNDDLDRQKILLSIYNCLAMRKIRHCQI